ncbi:hypothetical protein [Streptococcus agalactiae]|uniref:hypothetical protein n=1 Tax=Streptococcus agalactiae TaxID=1311 RepID=UPI0013034CD1|nr:hypothetical protein [Streptococcus agalactiae]KAF0052063.1 hypothetical protein GL192_00855 [Streptococcus agalactiae]
MTQQLTLLEKKRVGFFEGFYHLIPESVITLVFLDLSSQEMTLKTEEDVKTLILVKSLKMMTYQEFRVLRPYLFTYQETSTSRPLVETIEETPLAFHCLKAWAREKIEGLCDD